MQLAPVDYLILIVYFAFVLGIGWMLRKTNVQQQRFSDGRTLRAGVDHQPRVHRRQPGGTGTYRHVGVGREVWNHDRPFLLDWRHSSHPVRGHFHDAVLLRQQSALTQSSMLSLNAD